MRRTTSTPPELPGYDFIKVLGSGGFSDVFLYQQRLPRREVAVKVLLTEQLGPSTRAQFAAEANLMAQLSTHPYIVTIYHADVAGDDRPYFAMEYCSGPSLAERYKRERFSVEDALRTGVRLAGAIATAHGAGILHRDIKPANVLTNAFGWPALTDFGISSTLEDELPVHTITGASRSGADATGTSESQSVGMSVPWSPPEMFDDDPRPDVRSDVFSLAATIHTLLAGQTPYEIRGRSNGTLDLIGRIERGAITPIARDDVPRSLAAVLQKGMATRRADRYASALDFARALQRIELELGYAPTGIEVPTLHLAQQEKPDAPAGEDETRARSVTTISAQDPARAPFLNGTADAGPRAAEEGAAPPEPAPRADETRVRGAVVVDPQQRTGRTLADSSPVVGETIVRPVHTGGAAAAHHASSDDAPSGRGRALTVGISTAAAVLVVGAIVAAVALSGSPGGMLGPTKQPATGQPGDATIAAGVPQPTLQNTTTSVDGTVVAFTIGNPDPEDGDLFRWARTETPNQPHPSTSAEISIDGVTPGTRVCIDVYLQRKNGKVSEPLTACNT
ncbi:serine/threonine-protein kinase [Glaciibacter sp. 2TAF33]|uniref:serine/threonine-protein kinase n=1 Tax=Glaciibacter sp. 2TAF33 TaxID=3233015 RepID=UPI003F8DDDFA